MAGGEARRSVAQEQIHRLARCILVAHNTEHIVAVVEPATP